VVSYEFFYLDDADDAMARLEGDPAMAHVLAAVERTLDKLAADPFSHRLGTTAFMTEEYGGISATPVGTDDWYVFWQRGPEPRTIDIVLVDQLRL
jgi:hypothetical protein